MKPLVVINFKNYKQGKEVIRLARIIEKVSSEIIIGIPASDIYEVVKAANLKVYAQHVDYFEKGRHTGFIIPDSVKKDGAEGTFLNHSEHKLPFKILKKTIERCNKSKLKTLVFASSLHEAKKIQKLKPDYIAIEPPELVAGKISISEAKPDLIKNIAKNLKMKFLVGAGIHSSKDVKIAMKLGASGIAVSSAVAKAKNPEKALKELLNFKI